MALQRYEENATKGLGTNVICPLHNYYLGFLTVLALKGTSTRGDLSSLSPWLSPHPEHTGERLLKRDKLDEAAIRALLEFLSLMVLQSEVVESHCILVLLGPSLDLLSRSGGPSSPTLCTSSSSSTWSAVTVELGCPPDAGPCWQQLGPGLFLPRSEADSLGNQPFSIPALVPTRRQLLHGHLALKTLLLFKYFFCSLTFSGVWFHPLISVSPGKFHLLCLQQMSSHT